MNNPLQGQLIHSNEPLQPLHSWLSDSFSVNKPLQYRFSDSFSVNKPLQGRLWDSFSVNEPLQGRLSDDERRDESTNRTSGILHVLHTIATVSPVCEKKATFAFCSLIRDKHFDVQLVKKVKVYSHVTSARRKSRLPKRYHLLLNVYSQ